MNTPKPTSPEALRELILKDGRRRLGGKARVALAVAGLGLAGLLAWALVGGNGNDGANVVSTETFTYKATDALGNSVCWLTPEGRSDHLSIISELDIERFPAVHMVALREPGR